MPDFSCLWMNSGEDDTLRADYQGEEQEGEHKYMLTETRQRPIKLSETEFWTWNPTRFKSNLRKTNNCKEAGKHQVN